MIDPSSDLERTPGSRVPFLAIAFALAVPASLAATPARQVVKLDGTWRLAEGGIDAPPARYDRAVPVPGLVDMAEPLFADVGVPSPRRNAFWYRRTFRLDSRLPEAAWLKIHKAMYGTKVWVNGRLAGEHLPCFTPAWLDVRALLREGGENELVVRVGAGRRALPDGMPKGFDFEKRAYVPGIYDSVDLHLGGAPRVVNVQAVPDLEGRRVRVVAEVEAGARGEEVRLRARVAEAVTGREAGRADAAAVRLAAGDTRALEVDVPLSGLRAWSPEDPFLYRLVVSTGADEVATRFGMRSFRFDPATKRAVLNGRPYYLRGSNVTIFRFFEDDERSGLPWTASWVRGLHRKLKAMHWNALRYCIGFPPEAWYDVADEEGILIQDEFPVWLLANKPIDGTETEAPDPVTAETLVPEYREWMRERWNHPSVVIWDAQNESETAETGKALRQVRHLDRSGRPWENGWGEPQDEGDAVEAHPYLFNRDFGGRAFPMSEMAALPRVPELLPAQKRRPATILVNEYAWLWLNRQGDPTTVTHEVYRNQLGPSSTPAARRALWAKLLAAKTEFWRSHRECAGVLHFCSLGYSRRGDVPQPRGGATSDHWRDVARLEWDRDFERYVRDAFAPVGVMLDFWEPEVARGARPDVRVAVIDDLYEDWAGEVRLRLERAGRVEWELRRSLAVPSLGRAEAAFTADFSGAPGECTLVAEIRGRGGAFVRSRRDVRITPGRRDP